MQHILYASYKKLIILGIIIIFTTWQLLNGYNYNIATNVNKNIINALVNQKDKLNSIETSLEEVVGISTKLDRALNTNLTHRKTQKIFLVSSNPRTGSSYVANIITAIPNSSYYYEPLRVLSHLTDNRQVI